MFGILKHIGTAGKKVLAKHFCFLNVLVFGITAVLMKATPSRTTDTEYP